MSPGVMPVLSFPEMPRWVSVCRISEFAPIVKREPNAWFTFTRNACLL